MEIKKGNTYLCIRSMYDIEENEVYFVKGKVYLCEVEGRLTNEYKILEHISAAWSAGYFKPYIENPVTDAVGVNPDPINPTHYKRGNEYEPIKIIQHYNLSFELGNVIKYVLRCDSKGKREEDLKKAMRYLQYELDKAKK